MNERESNLVPMLCGAIAAVVVVAVDTAVDLARMPGSTAKVGVFLWLYLNAFYAVGYAILGAVMGLILGVILVTIKAFRSRR